MFVVMPYLSSNPNIFGIYSVCISINIFLSYADLGFITSGQKFAAEYYARRDIEGEILTLGFSSFVFFIFIFIFSFTVFFLSLNPSGFFKNINNTNEMVVAAKLLKILCVGTIINFMQRIGQVIYSIRLEDYIPQRINLVANILRIVSIFFFFDAGKYNIVGFYLFFQVISLISSIVILYTAKIRYNYNFKLLIQSFRFNLKTFNETYKLAFTSFFVMLTWVLYYELDQTIIGKYIGVKEVAIYGIGITVLSFFRGIFGIIYSPINTRFNHFIGDKNNLGLIDYYYNISVLTAPLIIIPIVTIFLGLKPLILSWIGIHYYNSIYISKFLILCNIFAFISYPAGMLLVAKQKVKYLNILAFFLPIVFWFGVYFLFPSQGIKAFAILKLVIFFLLFIFYSFITYNFLKERTIHLFKKILSISILPILYIFILSNYFNSFSPIVKSKINLLINMSLNLVIILTAFLIVYFTSSYHKFVINSLIKKVFNKKS